MSMGTPFDLTGAKQVRERDRFDVGDHFDDGFPHRLRGRGDLAANYLDGVNIIKPLNKNRPTSSVTTMAFIFFHGR